MKSQNSKHKQRVFNTAAKYIMQYGIKGWNMDQLAMESAVSKRTLYKIIGSKQRLLENIVMDYICQTQDRITCIIKSNQNYIETLHQIINEFPILVSRFDAAFIKDIFLEYPDIEELVYEKRQVITENLIKFLDQGIEQKVFKSELNAELILQLLQAQVMYFVKFESEKNEFSQKIKLALNCILHGILDKK